MHDQQQNSDGTWSEATEVPFYDGLLIHCIKRFCNAVVKLLYRLRGGVDRNPTKFQRWCRSGEFIGWGKD